ncbi:hypothetical protein PsorP6_006920 [Peronosclerospora sorghi]|uniref:Uncharacterized protein n=1 Tax=Peronosclerospora sorghi TaxID=230839 RepID=A0ACC0WB43_9STRA|nr:hypothetical protein PsorP6_006920 [Peronosclerospora sorghi]
MKKEAQPRQKKGWKEECTKAAFISDQIDALRKEEESLVKLHSTEVETIEKSHAREIEELHELLEQVERLTREKTQTM